MMRRLDRRGAAAFEFCIIAVALFTLVYVLFEFGRYAITMQSLRVLANAGARKIMIGCYSDAAIQKATPSCSGDPLSSTEKQDAAPFLFRNGGGSVGLNATTTASIAVCGNAVPAPTTVITVTASQCGFTIAMFPITALLWGTSFDNPSASTDIPF